jgi:hypothetical protein
VVATLAIAAVGSGCTIRRQQRVTGGELHRNLGALRRDGSATVEVIERRVGDDEDVRRRPARLRADQPLTLDGKPHALAALSRGCRDVPPFADDAVSQADCALVALRERELVVRTVEDREYGRPIGLGVLLAAAVGGAIGFHHLNGSDSTVETVGNHALGAAIGFFGAGLVWMVVDCKGRWGSPGCRD